MENYILRSDETILFRGSAVWMPEGKRDAKTDIRCDVMLTNYSIVLTVHIKKFFKTSVEVYVYKTADVKIYDETIQVKRNKAVVDVYLQKKELFLDFEKEKPAKEFCDNALRLISGNSKLVRSVKKTQKAIKETNEALDIDVVKIAKKTATLAGEVTVGVASIKGMGKGMQVVGKIAEVLLHKNKGQETAQIAAPSEESEAVDETKLLEPAEEK